MNILHRTLREQIQKPQQRITVLLSATCKGNDPTLPPCPLFHGSLGPMLFSDIANVTEWKSQLLLLQSHNITWTQNTFFPNEPTVCVKICDTLAKTRYSSRSIKSVQLHVATLAISCEFIKNHCGHAAGVVEFRGIIGAVASGLINNECLFQLSKLSQTRVNVTDLDLESHPAISDEGLEHLSKLASTLQQLSLQGCDDITTVGCTHLFKLVNLQYLSVAWCAKVNEFRLTNKLPRLLYLHLSRTGVSDSSLETFPENLPVLQELYISFCERISDYGLEYVSKIASLERLELFDNSYITDIGVRYLLKLTSLNQLNLKYCNKVSRSTIRELEQKFPDIDIEH